MKKTLIALLSAACIATLLVPTIALGQPVNSDKKKSGMPSPSAKARHHHMAGKFHQGKADRSKSTPGRGVHARGHKAGNYKGITFCVPQRHPHQGRTKPTEGTRSHLERGVGTSEPKEGKLGKKTLSVPHTNIPPAHQKK